MMFHHIKRLAGHAGVYGAGILIQAVLGLVLLPLYTHYLTRAEYGALETVVAGSSLLAVVLRSGISTAFFRFYFQSRDRARRLTVVRTSFWFTVIAATAGMISVVALAVPLSEAVFGGPGRASLVRAGGVALWAQMNYAQLTSLFRAEERSKQYVLASLANLVLSVSATVLLVVGFNVGPLGVMVGNFAGTLVVYVALLAYRREQLGFEFDRQLLRAMQRFGLPLAASGLALWAVNFIDRFFLVLITGESETGVYSLAARVASGVALVLAAFATAWPAFAFSIEDDREARETFGYVLTYLLYVACWLSLALGLLAPWIVRLLAPSNPTFWPASDAVALLSFAFAAFAGYGVTSTATARTGRTEFNWVVTGSAAVLNIGLNVALIPTYGMMGAAVATMAAYGWMFAAMTVYSQRIYPVPYQWSRITVIAAVSVGLTLVGKALDAPLPVAIALAVSFPFVLAAVGFYQPDEWRLLRRVVMARR
jgi:O-antigen/teichoic acid export membrane protein